MNTMMKRRFPTIIKIILLVLCIIQLSYLSHRVFFYIKHYPVLTGDYCFVGTAPVGYIENKNINDTYNIQQCSLENINACQNIHNQTLLFRLHETAGFTSEINNLIRAFIYAIKTRRKFLVDDGSWNYGSLSSLFDVSQARFSPWLPASPYCSGRKFVHFIHYKPDNKTVPEHFTVARDTNGGFTTLNEIMGPLEKNNNQTLQVKRIVARYLWSLLNNTTRNFIDDHLNKTQINHLTYGLHIRRGDKLDGEANKTAVEKYINGIIYFMNKYVKNDAKPRIYVASDESNVVNKLKELKPDWEFVQISLPVTQSNGHHQLKFNRLSSDTKLALTRILLTDLEILSRVKYVVCTFSSNICRFVQILRDQEPDTVLSLDERWYPS